MKLLGKRVERQNKFGENYCIEVHKKGQLKLSPALLSALGINSTTNKVGFAYPETEDESLYIYVAPDNSGVAINKQGYILNLPHWRDLKSHFSIEEGAIINVATNVTTIVEYDGFIFLELNGIKTEGIDADRGYTLVDRSEPVTEDETYSEQEAKIQEAQDNQTRIEEGLDHKGGEFEDVEQSVYDIEQGKVQKSIVNNEVEHVEAPVQEPTGDSMDIF